MTASQIHPRITWDLSGSSFFQSLFLIFSVDFGQITLMPVSGGPIKPYILHVVYFCNRSRQSKLVMVKMFRKLARKKL